MKIFFLVPGLSEKYQSGGLLVLHDISKIISKIPGYECQFVATHEIHPNALTTSKLFPARNKLNTGKAETDTKPADPLFVVSWGPLVSEHIKLIRRNSSAEQIIYYAQSFGWNIKVPPRIPIVCVSRFVMAQWALRTQQNPLFYIPPPINPIFTPGEDAPKGANRAGGEEKRDIDILIHTRKQNNYCLKELLPALQATTPGLRPGGSYKLHIVDQWIPQTQFAALLKRTKIFLYVTALHKAGLFRRLPGEGFGLPALEAIACGALVGSNLLGGVTDFLTPGENCIKLQTGDLAHDLKLIRAALEKFSPDPMVARKIAEEYSADFVAQKWKSLLQS